MSAPHIIQVHPKADGQMPGQLIGLRVVDPETLGGALSALGVEEAEVPDWTIYTDFPPHGSHDIEEPRVILRPHTVANRMLIKTRGRYFERDEDGFPRYTPAYTHAFHEVAGSVVLRDLARSVASDQGDAPTRAARLAERIVPPLSAGITYVAARHGLDMHPIAAIGMGIIPVAITQTTLDGRISIDHFATQRIETALTQDEALAERVGRAVLPIYQRSTSTS